jgi:hypothetical protein
VAREIDASFVETQKRLGLRQSASGTARLAYPYAKDMNTAAGSRRLASPRTKRQRALIVAREPAASVVAV